MNRINARLRSCVGFGFWSRDNENVFVVRSIFLNEADLLVDVAFHAAASRRVELGQVANFQGSFVIPSEVACRAVALA